MKLKLTASEAQALAAWTTHYNVDSSGRLDRWEQTNELPNPPRFWGVVGMLSAQARAKLDGAL